MDLGLTNKLVLVVGSSKGIGRAIAKSFVEEGCHVIAIARSAQLLSTLQDECKELGNGTIDIEVADIMSLDTKKFARMLQDKYGNFDIIIHNVGGSLVSRNHLAGQEDWIYALRFNALAAIDMNSVFLPAMIERKSGHIVHISSISAKMLRGNPLYASAKAFLNAYVTTTGRQVASSGVLLCSVMPGAVSFPGSYWDNFVKEGHPRVHDFLSHHQAVGRFGTPEEIANVVLFMASEKASFMQATNIAVDGANM